MSGITTEDITMLDALFGKRLDRIESNVEQLLKDNTELTIRVETLKEDLKIACVGESGTNGFNGRIKNLEARIKSHPVLKIIIPAVTALAGIALGKFI